MPDMLPPRNSPQSRYWSELSQDEIAIVKRLVGHTIAEVELELIRETLVGVSGNRTRAASVLGISIRGLRNKIRLYAACGILVPEIGVSAAFDRYARTGQGVERGETA